MSTVPTLETLENAALDFVTVNEVSNNPPEQSPVISREGELIKPLSRVMQDLAGVDNKGPWVTATLYVIKDLVQEGGVTYQCAVEHTSGVFATDNAAGKWAIYQTAFPEVHLSDYASLAAAVAAIGATPAVLKLDNDDTLTGNLTTPSTLSVVPLNGNLIDGAFTWTHNGPIVGAGLFQWLGSSTALAGSPLISQVYPQWFGAVADGVNDDTSAVEASIDLINSMGGGTIFLTGMCRITNKIEKTLENITFIGPVGKCGFVANFLDHMFEVFNTNYATNVLFYGVKFNQEYVAVKDVDVLADGQGRYLSNFSQILFYQADIENVAFVGCKFVSPDLPGTCITASPRINNTDTSGICNNLRIQDCEFIDIAGASMSILNRNHSASDKYTAMKDIFIKGNVFRNVGSYGEKTYGFLVTMDGVGSDFHIDGNDYETGAFDISSGIEILAGWKDGTVSNNVVKIDFSAQPFITTTIGAEPKPDSNNIKVTGNTFQATGTIAALYDINHCAFMGNTYINTSTSGAGGVILDNSNGNRFIGETVDWTASTSIANQMTSFSTNSAGNIFRDGSFLVTTGVGGSGNLGENVSGATNNIVKNTRGIDGSVIKRSAGAIFTMSDADRSDDQPYIGNILRYTGTLTAARVITLSEANVSEGVTVRNDTNFDINITFTGAVNNYFMGAATTAMVFTDTDANAIRGFLT